MISYTRTPEMKGLLSAIASTSSRLLASVMV
jgi:hypothetical protein